MSASRPGDRWRRRARPGSAPWARGAGIAAGVLADRVLGDPRRLHPVAGFGRLALAAEGALLRPGRSPAGQRAAGLLFTGALVGGATSAASAIGRLTARDTAATVLWTAAVVWSCLGGSSLLAVARRQGELLGQGDVAGSRELLPWLCGRDPAALDADDLARAVVESVAENTSDAAVATVFWAAVAGPAGAVAHRASNTLDAMVGHRSDRYRHFGTAAARLDDVLGFVPARWAGVLAAAAAPTVGGRPSAALRVWIRDARAHPSPNAGVVEAACAGALGVRLGGPTPYPYGVQDRAVLGDGRAVRAHDIGRAVVLHDRVQLSAAMMATAAAIATALAAARGLRADPRRRGAGRGAGA